MLRREATTLRLGAEDLKEFRREGIQVPQKGERKDQNEEEGSARVGTSFGNQTQQMKRAHNLNN
ncbi:Hypothetical protein PP7435_CHR3-2128 [Komagataella phaffii CBS 7435]|uniref:Uncharacterized protein n=1 Tax=Komagataella phaffii (strain ATCC 76273 / CBS 7435 / CECT 11047 / NRRL Y-11430 / Wegner 21-1) TaxID=981350 RepID=A0A1G4KQF9_KOMPC|nr:Hypothetical protein BQ9382_C3-3542 [Komagataella phaffii CBS 7435]SCV12235.1 Hypothetical protein PP7435_CHR3-2128 [Komagataella phaffii CBS 7435]